MKVNQTIFYAIIIDVAISQQEFQSMPNFNIPSQEALQIQIPPDRIRLPPQPCRCKKIDSGSYKTPYAWNSNHPMVKGTGGRKVTQWINFDENFTRPPKVQTSLSQLDSDSNINLRVNCRALNITKDRFLIEVSTWADTKLYSAVCSWIAHGY